MENRLAYVFLIRPDGSELVESIPLTEGLLTHLGGGEMVQITFSDGQRSDKIEPWYVQAWNDSSGTSPMVESPIFWTVLAVVAASLLILVAAIYRKRRIRSHT
jgi:hypothetical protein